MFKSRPGKDQGICDHGNLILGLSQYMYILWSRSTFSWFWNMFSSEIYYLLGNSHFTFFWAGYPSLLLGPVENIWSFVQDDLQLDDDEIELGAEVTKPMAAPSLANKVYHYFLGNRVVCPNFRHPALLHNLQNIFYRWKIVLQQLRMNCQLQLSNSN